MTNRKIVGIAVTPWGRHHLEGLDSVEIHRLVDDLKTDLATLWQEYDAIVFCLALGAVVRLIAPLLQSKATDPAIIVIDEAGKQVISVCGGHQGGAHQLTRDIAAQLGATPIVTGAAEHIGLSGIDQLGMPFGWQRGEGDWLGVSGAIARREAVEVLQESGSELWRQALPSDHPFHFVTLERPGARVWISHIQRRFARDSDFPKIQWHPRVLWLGIGCERGTPKSLLDKAIQTACQIYHLAEAAIAGIATIDLKQDEVGIVAVAEERQWCLRTYPAALLSQVIVPNPSQTVAEAVGTPSVAEAAALLASGKEGQLVAPKQVFHHAQDEGAVTIAIALAKEEYIGKVGKLSLVGIGPGAIGQMTLAARQTILAADVVIGYSRYLEWIKVMLPPGQIRENYEITQEMERAQRAVSLAKWGLQIALISSGDSGIYGMAGLVFEILASQQWDGTTPLVEVIPGVTALQAVAARVGAPIMHDFCAISLSDLLTPIDVILARVQAVALTDFVVGLYNPRSQTRITPLIQALEIFRRYRPLDTPVAIVKAAFRPEEEIILTTLNKIDIAQIDMFTTVLIGNSATQFYQNYLVTPRGYSISPQSPA